MNQYISDFLNFNHVDPLFMTLFFECVNVYAKCQTCFYSASDERICKLIRLLKDDIYKLNTIERKILNILCHVLLYLDIVSYKNYLFLDKSFPF